MPFFEVSENCSFHLYNIGCLSMIYRLKYAKSESNFDADFEHPTLQGVPTVQVKKWPTYNLINVIKNFFFAH